MAALPPEVVDRLGGLPKGLREHIRRSREVARELAQRHGVDPEAVDLGAAAHDLARAMKGESLLEEARRYGLQVHPVEQRAPVLLHGAVAALWLQRSVGISDSRVLDAVRWHSTGRKGMGSVAKVVFLADKLDPDKVKRYPYLDEVGALAKESLDRALVGYLDHELSHLLQRGSLVHPGSLELRNELIMALD